MWTSILHNYYSLDFDRAGTFTQGEVLVQRWKGSWWQLTLSHKPLFFIFFLRTHLQCTALQSSIRLNSFDPVNSSGACHYTPSRTNEISEEWRWSKLIYIKKCIPRWSFQGQKWHWSRKKELKSDPCKSYANTSLLCNDTIYWRSTGIFWRQVTSQYRKCRRLMSNKDTEKRKMESSNRAQMEWKKQTKNHCIKSTAQVFCKQVWLQSNKGQTTKPSPASLLQPRLALHLCAKEPEKLIQPLWLSADVADIADKNRGGRGNEQGTHTNTQASWEEAV